MVPAWSILYRGPLSSCNYECGYCPFAKTQNTRAELREDERCLRRFAAWVAGREEQVGVLFTPWGEALIHRFYQEILSELSHRPNVRRVAIQTNLSGRLDWLAQANPQTLALWCTFHPTQVSLENFLGQCRRLDEASVRYSVGCVGTRDAFPFIETLRRSLPKDVYVWVNALKREPDYYSEAEIRWLTALDPLFPINNQYHPSLGRRCRTGETVFSVDGDGQIRRCHFVRTVLGNIYEPGFERNLRARVCPAATCGCHIGYVHLEQLGLETVFGGGILERIPAELEWASPAR
jgi:MoaA/NifB/PqqE/SkfB family radical SAM enzyme